ncbi:MAG: hypothetical protein RDV41_05485 [Planctomycetota bacterium]|nr:hypothetical protein [Planctomycetota bacterium]
MKSGSLVARFSSTLAVLAFACLTAFAQEVKDEPDKDPKADRKRTPKEIVKLRMQLFAKMEDIELQRTYQRAMRKHDMLPQLQNECRQFYEAAPDKPLGIYIHSRALDDTAKRKELLDKLVALDPKHPWPHVDFGEIALDAKDSELAAKHFAKAEELAPESAGLFREIAGEYQRRNMPTQAIEWFEKAVKLDPAHVATLEALMTLCNTVERFQRVIELAAKLVEINPRNAWYWNMYGYGLHRTEKRPEAAEKYLKALEVSPKYGMPAYNLGLLSFDTGDFETAAGWFRKSTEWDPRYQSGWHKLIHILFKRQENYEEARKACMRALEYFPTDIWTCKVLSTSLKELKYESEAIVYWEVVSILTRCGVMTGVLEDLFEEGPTLTRGDDVAPAVEKLPLEHLELLAKLMPAVCKEVASSEKILLRASALRDDVNRALQKKKEAAGEQK